MEESEKNAPLGHENTSVKTEIIAFHLILLFISFHLGRHARLSFLKAPLSALTNKLKYHCIIMTDNSCLSFVG